MIKSIVTVGAALLMAPALASSQPFADSRANSVPLLSGTYLFVNRNPCQPQLIAGPAPAGIAGIALQAVNGNIGSVAVGTAVFTQGETSASGNVTISGIDMSGSPFLVKGGGSKSGKPWTAGSQNETESFTQTSAKLTLGSGKHAQVYDVYYGKTSGGVAQNAVAMRGPASKGGTCEDDLTAIHE